MALRRQIRSRRASSSGSAPLIVPPGYGTDLVGWYRGGNWDLASGEIAQWHDSSGNDNHATQPTGGNQPTATTLDGRACARFVAANTDHLILDALASVLNGEDKAYSWAARFRLASSSAGSLLTWGGDTTAAAGNHLTHQIQSTETAGRALRVRRRGTSTEISVESSESLTDTAADHITAFSSSGIAMTATLDGSVLTGFSAASCDVDAMAINKCTIGSQRNESNVNSPWDGYLFELMIWDTELTPEERQIVESLLA